MFGLNGKSRKPRDHTPQRPGLRNHDGAHRAQPRCANCRALLNSSRTSHPTSRSATAASEATPPPERDKHAASPPGRATTPAWAQRARVRSTGRERGGWPGRSDMGGRGRAGGLDKRSYQDSLSHLNRRTVNFRATRSSCTGVLSTAPPASLRSPASSVTRHGFSFPSPDRRTV